MISKILIIYNTCGISGREPVSWYTTCINSILEQKFESGTYDVLISSCLNNQRTKDILTDTFGSRVRYNFIDDRVTVNISFNHSILKSKEIMGDYDLYLYLDSGVRFDKSDQLYRSYNSLLNTSGLATIKVNNDTGFEPWLNTSNPNMYMGVEYIYQMPIGKACNLHAQYFSSNFVKSFLYKPIPDIFIAYCTESVFSFMAAACEQTWDILPDLVLEHNKSVDGATSGFDHIGPTGRSWNNLFGSLNINDIIRDPEAWASGFGYEELQGIFPHNPEIYEGWKHKDPGRLLSFIKDKLYLKENVLDYNKIRHKFI